MKDDIYKRLGISTNLKSERKKFIFRIKNEFKEFLSPITDSFDLALDSGNNLLKRYPNKYGHLEVLRKVNYELGSRNHNLIECLNVKNIGSTKFSKFIFRLEVILNKSKGTKIHDEIKNIIKKAFKNTVIDLGYKFIEDQEKFVKSGDEKLDKALVEKPLKEIKDSKYTTAKKHFDDALKFYLKKDYENSVTNSYSAIDSLAKTFLDSDRRVDKLKSKLLSEINLPQEWKKILAHYLDYAHEYGSRHGSRDKDGIDKKKIDKSNAEAYVYMTGLVIRLILESSPD